METGARSFWGVIIKPDKRYEQLVEEPFHISKACLEPTSTGGKAGKDSNKGPNITSVFIETEGEEFLICNLTDRSLNETLDLNFTEGDKIVFKTSGTGTVHLTGYNLIGDDDDDPMDDTNWDDMMSDGESSEEEVPALVNGNSSGKKRKALDDSVDKTPKSKKANKEQKSPLDKLLAEQRKISDAKSKKDNANVTAELKKAEEMRSKMAAAAMKRAGKQDEAEDSSDEDDDDYDGEEEADSDDNDFIEDEASEIDDEDGEEEESEDDEGMETEVSPKKQVNGTPKSDNKKAKTPDTPKSDSASNSEPGADGESPKKKKKKNKKNKNKEGKENTSDNSNKAAGATPEKNKTEAKQTPPAATPKTPKRTLKGGIVVEDLKMGNGPEAKPGKMVGMYYDGKLKSNNKSFDSTLKGAPFKFKLGKGEVIKGWDVGLEGIKVGGKRRLTIPPKLAYGAQGAAPDIPPNATLVFEVECKQVC